MRVFLSEYLTCGALSCGGDFKSSLAVEGAAMLRALAADAVAAGFEVAVTWDSACGRFDVPGVEVHASNSPAEEQEWFARLACQADSTLVIAPEFDRLLERRCHRIAEVGGRSAGAAVEAIRLCADKLRLAAHLQANGIATIPTIVCHRNERGLVVEPEVLFPLVIKPRDGAGSVHSFVVTGHEALAAVSEALASETSELIAQPFVVGHAVSIAAIVSAHGIEMLPVCAQNIQGVQLEYHGGSVPALVDCHDAIADVARRAIASVLGLRGYAGVDLILTPEGLPVVVEINPRLTSSYHGYRRLAITNLAPRVLFPDQRPHEIAWNTGRVAFSADGTARGGASPG